MKRKLHNVEFLRFLFALGLVHYHLLRANLVSCAPDPGAYARLADGCDWACLLVECFCVLAGWFLPASAERSASKPFVEVFLDRFFRLWPVFAVATLVHAFFGLAPQTAADQILLLHGVGLSPGGRGILWFVPPFFWANIFLLVLLRTADRKVAATLLGLVAFFGYAVNLGTTGGGLGRDVIWGFLSQGLLRVAAGMSLGAILSMASDAFARSFPEPEGNRTAATALFTLLEAAGPALLAKWLFFGHEGVRNPLVPVAVFSFAILLFANRAGWLSRLLDRPLFDRFGRYAYSIYVLQQVAFVLLAKTLWTRKAAFAARPVLFLVLSILLATALGVLAYHLVERPALRRWICWKNKRTRHP